MLRWVIKYIYIVFNIQFSSRMKHVYTDKYITIKFYNKYL